MVNCERTMVRLKMIVIVVMSLLHAQNFGIGTPTPTERLDVEGGRLRVRAYSGTGTRLATVDPTGVFGTLAGSAPGDILQWNGTDWIAAPAPATSNAWQLTGNVGTTPATNFLGTTDAQPIAFRTNNTEHMRLTATGLLGIGTTAPSERLHLVGNFHLQGAFMPGGNAGTAGAILTSQGPGTPPSWLAGTAPGQVLTWTAIGPQWQAAAANAWLLNGNAGTNPSVNFIGTTDNQPLSVNVNNARRGLFTNFGLLVYADYAAGTDMPAGAYPGIRPFTATSGSFDASGIVEADRDGNFATQNDKDLLIYWGDDFDDRVRFVFYSWNGTGTTPAASDAIRILASGNVGINVSTDPTFTLEVNGTAAKPGGGTWSTISDARLKSVIGPFKRGLKEILQLRPVVYRYRSSDAYPFSEAVLGETYTGFLAQEVQPVFPEAVRLSPNGYYTLDAYPLHVATINAIQELHNETETLRQDMRTSTAAIQSDVEVLRQQNQRLLQENAELRRRLEALEQYIQKSQ